MGPDTPRDRRLVVICLDVQKDDVRSTLELQARRKTHPAAISSTQTLGYQEERLMIVIKC